jgi:hypothetical protein
MTLRCIGGLSALVCGATYLIGFALLFTLLAPLGYGTAEIDPRKVVDFINAKPSVLIAWNTTIYVVNALALAVLVVALSEWQAGVMPGWSVITKAFGLIWATLVLGAGMIANVAVERAAHLHAADPQAAAAIWGILHAVELGLGGGNEIVGSVWILCVSMAGLIGHCLARPVAILGILTGVSGLATILPALGDTAGAIFGLGAIVWFLGVGAILVTDTAPRLYMVQESPE